MGGKANVLSKHHGNGLVHLGKTDLGKHNYTVATVKQWDTRYERRIQRSVHPKTSNQ